MVIRKAGLFGLLVVAMLFIGDVSATPTEILPSSSHYQGRSYYDEWTAGGHLTGRIDFAVYDTVAHPDEFVGADGFVNPGGNRYVYAYQIFCDDDATTALDYFAILNIDESGIGIGASDIDSQDDVSGDSVEPDLEYFTSSTTYGGMAVWEFDGGYLVAGEHSWFLVLSSDQDWIVGGYTFDKTVADGAPAPPPGNPEPCTLALLGFGGVMEFIRRRKLLRERTAC